MEAAIAKGPTLLIDLTQPVNVTALGWELPKDTFAPNAPPPPRFSHAQKGMGGERRTPEVRLQESLLQVLENIIGRSSYVEMVESATLIDQQAHPGRPATTTPSAITVLNIATRLLRSQRAAIRELSDPRTWHRLCTCTRALYPDRPDLWLPDRCPSRDAQRRAITRLGPYGFVDAVQRICEADAFDAARIILETSPTPFTNPAPGNVVVGDATTIKANTYYAPNTMGTRRDGSKYLHRADPTARRIGKGKRHTERHKAPTDDSGRQPRGLDYVFITIRNRQGNERIILGIQPRPAGTGEAEVFTDFLLEHQVELPMATVAVFDGAMRGGQANRLIESGIVPTNKVPRVSGGQADTANLGLHPFKRRDGSIENLPIVTIDGHAGILVMPEDEWWIPLTRGQVRPRKTTIYVTMQIPSVPHVPARLRGATCLLRLNSTVKEQAAGVSRADHLRAFPEQDSVFQDLYGLREDVESLNAKFKDSLWGRRARTADPELNRLDLAMFQLIENARARVAHQARIGRQANDPPLARAG